MFLSVPCQRTACVSCDAQRFGLLPPSASMFLQLDTTDLPFPPCRRQRVQAHSAFGNVTWRCPLTLSVTFRVAQGIRQQGRLFAGLTGRSASSGKCYLQTAINDGAVLHLQETLCAAASFEFVLFCRLQAPESGGSRQVTATSGGGEFRCPRGRCSEGAVALCHR